MKCEYIEKNRGPIEIYCNYKSNYGSYCYKHRKNYLLEDNKIILNRFTHNIKDYTITDLKYTLKCIWPKWNKRHNKLKKPDLFKLLLIVKDIDIYFESNINHIIKIQSHIRRKSIQTKMEKGPGYINKELCKNDEDFYFMTSVEETEDTYFFSYKDNSNNVWFFDIRSLKRLLDQNQNNPYTRDEFPENVKIKAYNLLNKLSKQNIDINIDEFMNVDKKNIIKQKIVNLCSDLSQSGYYCDIEWFLSLSRIQLKKLYKNLEDIWNYRAYLTDEVKSRISPPNGLVFNIPIIEVYNYTDKNDLRDIILSEVSKFNNAISSSDKKLGYMFFLIGLSEVSRECLDAHEWIQYALN